MMLRDFGVTGLVATPSYALYLGELVRESPYPKEAYASLKYGILGSEGCTEEMRQRIEENLGVTVTDNYGMTELTGPGVSGECHLRCGLHFAEDAFLPEIIDQDTLEQKPAGEVGELVVTTLTRKGMPVLRYRTKDITRLHYEPCACGRTHVRMDKVMGRTDDMLIIKGVNVFPSQIESVLVGMENVGPHYQLVVRKRNYLDTLEVKVELVDASLLESFGELQALQKKIHDRLKSVLGLETKVTLVSPRAWSASRARPSACWICATSRKNKSRAKPRSGLKVSSTFSKGRYVPVGRCPAANRGGSREVGCGTASHDLEPAQPGKENQGQGRTARSA